MEKINGLKTIIGILVLVPAFAEYVSSEEVETIINAIAVIAGGVMTLVGVVHKIIKRNKVKEL